MDTVLLTDDDDLLVLDYEYQEKIHALVYFLSGLAYKMTDTLMASTFFHEGLKFNQCKLLFELM